MHHYTLFGLHLESPLLFPELSPANRDGSVDVRIRFGTIPRRLSTPDIQVEREEALLRFDSVGRFLIRRGREITVEPAGELTGHDLRLYLLGSCMGTLLMQRGYQNLHGSAVKMDGKAVLFLGRQGAGKSTLAAYLERRGCPLLSDDLCPVSKRPGEKDDRYYLTPAYPQMKLWGNSLELLGKGSLGLRRICSVREKFALSPDNFEADPLPIKHIFLLNYCEEIEIVPVVSHLQARVLMNNTYRPQLFQSIFTRREHFKRSVAISSKAPVHFLRRPRDLSRLPEVVEALERHLSS